MVFERDNFDELLNGNEEGAVAIPKSDSGFQAAKAPPALSGEASDFTEPVGRLHAVAGVEQPQSVKAEIRDYVLSKRRLMLIGIGVIVWSIVIFAAGIFVGCSLTPGG